jgi:tetratricopeptide (TPR) repeat protein
MIFMSRAHAVLWMIILSLALSGPGIARAGEKAGGKVEKAKEYFDRGIILFKAGDYKGALDNFRISYTWRPHYKIRYNMGTCLFAMGKFADAGNELQAFLTDGGDSVDPGLKTKVLHMLLEIQPEVSRLTVTVDVAGADISVDKKLYGKSPYDDAIYLEPGKHTIFVKSAEGEEWKGTYNFAPGKSRVVNVVFEQEKEEGGKDGPMAVVEDMPPGWDSREKAQGSPGGKGWKSPGMIGFYSTAGLAIACVVVASVTGGLALEKTGGLEDLDRQCIANGCDADAAAYEEYRREKEEASDEALLTGRLSTGFFIASGAAAAAAVVLIALFAPRAGRGEKKEGGGKGAALAPGPGGAALEVRF